MIKLLFNALICFFAWLLELLLAAESKCEYFRELSILKITSCWISNAEFSYFQIESGIDGTLNYNVYMKLLSVLNNSIAP